VSHDPHHEAAALLEGAPASASAPELELNEEALERETLAQQARLDAARARTMIPPPGAKGVELGVLLGRVMERVAEADPTELRRRAEASARQRVADLRARAREVGLPEDEDLRTVALDDEALETDALAAFRAAVAWRGLRRRGMVAMVGGNPGVGKTAGMAHALLRADAGALFVPASEIAATPRNGFSENLHAWGRWQSVQLLAIDDLGAEIGEAESITALMCARYDAGRATLCTTNLSKGRLAERYFAGDVGLRLADRLVNAQGLARGAVSPGPGGLGWYVEVRGASLRNASARAALVGG
jgi:DNA replication protein DnaC